MSSWRAAHIASLALLLFLSLTPSRAQMTAPMAGQGGFPEEPKAIHVSALQERLLAVDDASYRFENIVYVYLTWEDTLANQAMVDSTDSYRNGTKDECFKPCASVEQNLPRKVPQGVYLSDISCCDGVWLPDVGMMNVYELPEGRLQPYSIQITGRSVAWWVAIHAVYFTPMDFKRFPFDRQENFTSLLTALSSRLHPLGSH